MMNYFKNHAFQYFTILLLFSISVYAISSSINIAIKIFLVIITIAIYFFWAIWHHWENHKMGMATLIEYLLLAALLGWLLLSLAQ